jgi:hypothetical protein
MWFEMITNLNLKTTEYIIQYNLLNIHIQNGDAQEEINCALIEPLPNFDIEQNNK